MAKGEAPAILDLKKVPHPPIGDAGVCRELPESVEGDFFQRRHRHVELGNWRSGDPARNLVTHRGAHRNAASIVAEAQ